MVGTALLLGGGTAAAAWGPQRLLGGAPMRWVGDRSYSFYLWHWPALILVAVASGGRRRLARAARLAGRAGVSDLSYRYVENPFRDRMFFRPR